MRKKRKLKGFLKSAVIILIATLAVIAVSCLITLYIGNFNKEVFGKVLSYFGLVFLGIGVLCVFGNISMRGNFNYNYVASVGKGLDKHMRDEVQSFNKSSKFMFYSAAIGVLLIFCSQVVVKFLFKVF